MRLLHYPVPVRFHLVGMVCLDKAAQLRRAGCRLWPRQAIARARRNRLVAEMKGFRLP